MVNGLDRFKLHFADYSDQYILIGGTACTIAMENVGQSFRATKDLDIVLCVEVLEVDFVTAFWQFIRDGQYESRQKASGKQQFYRFEKPSVDGYPFMLELFSRSLDVLTPVKGSVLTPIPMDDDISSLSAILLDTDYYKFLQAGKQIVDGISIAGPEHIIPLKARVWIDLSERKKTGVMVDSRAIKKHKNDVFRLFAIADPGFTELLPEQVKLDLAMFLDRIKDEPIDLKMLGIGSHTLEDVVAELRRMYRLD